MARKQASVPEWIKDITDDPEYQRNLKARAQAGILPSNLEMRLLEYRLGKPPEEINVSLDDYSNKSTEELLALNEALQQQLADLRTMEARIASAEKIAPEQQSVAETESIH